MSLNDFEGPVGSTDYRVPRTRVDDYFERGQPVEPNRTGAGVVTSVDGDTCSVIIGDEEVSGIVYMGDPPEVGEPYELELRGDLLVALADDFDYEGVISGGGSTPHIVDDDVPGAPPPVEVPIAGSMKDQASWNFLSAGSGWHDDLDVTGIGIRCYQAAGVVQARNLMPTPSYEAGLGLWYSDARGGSAKVALLYDDAARFLFGGHSMLVEWVTPDAGQTSANAVYPKIALDPAKRYTASMFVFVPEGSPDVRAVALGNAGGPLVTAREAWTFTQVDFSPTDAAGDLVGIETEGPLTTTRCWVDGVVLREAGTPMPPTNFFDGSLPATPDASFAWDGTPSASTSFWRNGPAAPATTGVLWSTEEFPVVSGDTLDFTATFKKLAGADATAQMVVAYSAVAGATPVPGTDPQAVYGPVVAVSGESIPLAAQAIVPETIGAGTDTPKSAVVGIQFVGAGTADLLVTSAKLMHATAHWGVGTIWLNPEAGSALPTVGTTPLAVTPTAITYAGSPTAWGRMPLGNKAVVTAPPDSGGIVLAFYTAVIRSQSGSSVAIGSYVSIQFDGAIASASPPSRYMSPQFGNTEQRTVPVNGWAQVDAGATVECFPAFQYASNPGSTGGLVVMDASLTVLFIPNGVPAGAPTKPPPVSFWDGSDWRPGMLDPAVLDLTQAAFTPPPTKAATTVSLARSDSDVHAYVNVTLTATVGPLAADGTVTFWKSSAGSTGPWTSMGSVTLNSSNKATKSVESAGATYWFKATYNGSAAHLASTSAVTSVIWRKKDTRTASLNARYVQAYNGDGAKVSAGTGYDNAVHQGVASGGSGNRKSLIGFAQPTFYGTDVKITSVVLYCRDWHQWMAGDHRGTAVVGWHESRSASEPGSYPSSLVHVDRSRHERGQGAWNANITSWADTIVGSSLFGGITVGPGGSSASEFYGWSENGISRWDLVITYESWS